MKELTQLANSIHAHNKAVGWWDKPATLTEKLLLVHSEISEGVEAYRKDLKDDHLPEHDGLDVEIADAIIRLLDIAAYKGYDVGQTICLKIGL